MKLSKYSFTSIALLILAFLLVSCNQKAITDFDDLEELYVIEITNNVVNKRRKETLNSNCITIEQLKAFIQFSGYTEKDYRIINNKYGQIFLETREQKLSANLAIILPAFYKSDTSIQYSYRIIVEPSGDTIVTIVSSDAMSLMNFSHRSISSTLNNNFIFYKERMIESARRFTFSINDYLDSPYHNMTWKQIMQMFKPMGGADGSAMLELDLSKIEYKRRSPLYFSLLVRGFQLYRVNSHIVIRAISPYKINKAGHYVPIYETED